MEQNTVELLEEIEQDLVVEVKEETTMKEYEKLLLAEKNRKDYEMAFNLVKFGCFEQKEELEVDYSKLQSIPREKKFKGLYDLYRNIETNQLLFICPLVEDNKGDADEVKDAKPYAYDIIYVDYMDDDTYKQVCKAAKNNLTNKVSVLKTVAWVLYFVMIGFFLWQFGYVLVTSSKNGLITCLISITQYCDTYIGLICLATIFLGLFTIRYNKYKDQ